MKVLIQRVHSASVVVDQKTIGSIGNGLLVYQGLEKGDDASILEPWASKIVQLRIFNDEVGKMNRSLLDVQGSILLVSQFTLAGSTKRGRRPSWDRAMPGHEAEPLYIAFKKQFDLLGVPTELGKFGADMQVHSINDGPVTLWLDPPNL